MIGGFFDRYHESWDETAIAWFEALVEEDDAEIMAWALSTEEPPEHIAGPMLESMRRLDYVRI